nr:Down syndrome cell adhesion molecule-like protein 1 homolog [Penaeus vannamei]
MVNEPRSSVPPRITDSRSSIRASVRDTVELPCAAQGYPIPQYKWHRLSQKEEVPVVQDGRIKQVGGSLLIRQVTAGDAGKYVCVVSSSVGSERTHTTLEVWAPLTAHITPQVQTVDVGSIATFNCSPEGFPQESISWFKDGERLEVTGRVRVEGQRTVVVEDVRREDRGMYQCLVKNFEDTAQGSAQLKLGDASPQWRTTSGPKVVSPGATVMLMCAVQGSPPPAITWTLQGQPIPHNDPRITYSQKVEGDHVEGQLNMTSIRVEDGGDWTCEARNRAGRVEHTGRLDVRGPPTIRPMRPMRVVAGRTAMFNCIVAGYPIESIYWEKNGVVLPVSERQEVHSNGTLEIRQVSREADSGQYICVATSGENTARANLQVNVMVPPHIDERMFSLGSGFPAKSRARIMCVVERGDLPLSFSWTHDGRPLAPGPATSVRSLDEVTSVLLFTSLREEDGGKYTCTATNAVASDSRTVELVVKEIQHRTPYSQSRRLDLVKTNIPMGAWAYGRARRAARGHSYSKQFTSSTTTSTDQRCALATLHHVSWCAMVNKALGGKVTVSDPDRTIWLPLLYCPHGTNPNLGLARHLAAHETVRPFFDIVSDHLCCFKVPGFSTKQLEELENDYAAVCSTTTDCSRTAGDKECKDKKELNLSELTDMIMIFDEPECLL